MEGLLPVLTAFIAACATLAGVFLNNHLARRERSDQRVSESRRDAAEALLRRGEELFLFADRLDGYVARHVELIEHFCHGHIDQAQYVSRREELLKIREGLEFGRFKLSVQAFFPQIAELQAEAFSNLGHLATLDSLVTDAVEPNATTVYKLSADAVRLRKVSHRNGQTTRASLAEVVRKSFAVGQTRGEAAKPLDPSGAAR